MNLQHEFYRKCLHLLLLVIPLTYHYLGKWKALMVFAPVTLIIISLDFARRRFPKIKNFFAKIFGPVLRPQELSAEKLCGASFVGLATCLNFSLFKPEIAICGFLILIISDAAAALIGKSIPSKPFFEKSFAGSLSFFIFGLLILFGCGIAFHTSAWFYVFGIFAVFCVTMFEARPSLFNTDDNFVIPIGFSVIMTFFDLVWNYSY